MGEVEGEEGRVLLVMVVGGCGEATYFYLEALFLLLFVSSFSSSLSCFSSSSSSCFYPSLPPAYLLFLLFGSTG